MFLLQMKRIKPKGICFPVTNGKKLMLNLTTIRWFLYTNEKLFLITYGTELNIEMVFSLSILLRPNNLPKGAIPEEL